MCSTGVGDVQAIYVTTPDTQQQEAPQNIQAMDIIPTDDQLVPVDLQVMDINQHIDNQAPGGAQHSAAAAVLDGSPWMQDPEQSAPHRVSVSNFTTSLHGQPTTLSCPLKKL